MYTEFMSHWQEILNLQKPITIAPELTEYIANAKKILYLIPDLSGSVWYRGIQWIYRINRYYPTDYNVALTNIIKSAKAIHSGAPMNMDIIIYQRQDSADILHTAQALQKRKVVQIYEIDDDLFNVPKWNPVAKDSTTLLRETIKNMLRVVDYITVSTDSLKDLYSRYKDPKYIKVIPNAIDFDLFNKYEKKGSLYKDKVVVGWTGSHSHYEDLKLIEPVIKRLIKERDDVIFYIAGWNYCPFFLDLPSDRVINHPWVGNIKEHYSSLHQIDIGLCPLVNIPFNRGKSNLKYLELSAMRIPSICSDVTPYSTTIPDSHHGLLVGPNPDDWYEAIVEMIEDKQRRDTIAYNAQRYVKIKYNQQSITQDLMRFFKEIL